MFSTVVVPPSQMASSISVLSERFLPSLSLALSVCGVVLCVSSQKRQEKQLETALGELQQQLQRLREQHEAATQLRVSLPAAAGGDRALLEAKETELQIQKMQFENDLHKERVQHAEAILKLELAHENQISVRQDPQSFLSPAFCLYLSISVCLLLSLCVCLHSFCLRLPYSAFFSFPCVAVSLFCLCISFCIRFSLCSFSILCLCPSCIPVLA